VLEGARVQVFFGACGRQSSMTVLEGARVLHRPFLRSFRGVGIFSVARHVSAQQLRLWLCSLRELPFSMLKKPSSCAAAFVFCVAVWAGPNAQRPNMSNSLSKLVRPVRRARSQEHIRPRTAMASRRGEWRRGWEPEMLSMSLPIDRTRQWKTFGGLRFL
jgi:hypothetical protein